jgi:Flp pilus assembly protein TadG
MKNIYSLHLAKPLRQTGIAAVECVIVLPLVLFLILAVAEVGNAIQQYNSLTHAARDAARYASKKARVKQALLS